MSIKTSPFEIKISNKPVGYKKAVNFLEDRVLKVHANLEKELIWILEHDSIYTKGISASNNDLLMPNLFPVIETNRGGKFTYHGPGQKIIYFVINLNKREKEIKAFVDLITPKTTIKYADAVYRHRNNVYSSVYTCRQRQAKPEKQ